VFETLGLVVEAFVKGLIVLGPWAALHDAVPSVRRRRGAQFGILITHNPDDDGKIVRLEF
jgi:hypothetical protein